MSRPSSSDPIPTLSILDRLIDDAPAAKSEAVAARADRAVRTAWDETPRKVIQLERSPRRAWIWGPVRRVVPVEVRTLA